MKIAYFDCFSGASGNMIVGALVDAGVEPERLKAELAKLPLDGYELHFDKRVKHTITATHLEVEVLEKSYGEHADHHHEHATDEHSHHHPSRHLSDILQLLEASTLDDAVKQTAAQIFDRLAEAEARIHGRRKEEVHLHEVSGVDSIVDIVGAVLALHLLGIEEVHCSPIALGRGFVRCAHGTMPVPAPGTLELLKGVPVEPTGIAAELTTPTGAAILSTLAVGFGPMPEMTVERVGYGAGTRDLTERPNLLRVCLGQKKKRPLTDHVLVLETNLDDMSPEAVGYVIERLFALGALDVFAVPIFMKKNRPATLLTVIARPEEANALTECLLRETTTFGIRFREMERIKLERDFERVSTEYGEVRIKRGYHQGEPIKAVPEYEDCRRLAQRHGVPFQQVYRAAEQAARQD